MNLCRSIKEFGSLDVTEAFVFALDKLGFDVLGRDKESGNWIEFRCTSLGLCTCCTVRCLDIFTMSSAMALCYY